MTKRSFHFSGKFTDWTDSRLKSDCKQILQTGELLKTPKKNRHISYHLHLEKKKIFREDFFLLTKRSFNFSGKFTDWTDSRLKSDCKQIVQTRELLKSPKKQTYLISPTSREIEDF